MPLTLFWVTCLERRYTISEQEPGDGAQLYTYPGWQAARELPAININKPKEVKCNIILPDRSYDVLLTAKASSEDYYGATASEEKRLVQTTFLQSPFREGDA